MTSEASVKASQMLRAEHPEWALPRASPLTPPSPRTCLSVQGLSFPPASDHGCFLNAIAVVISSTQASLDLLSCSRIPHPELVLPAASCP